MAESSTKIFEKKRFLSSSSEESSPSPNRKNKERKKPRSDETAASHEGDVKMSAHCSNCEVKLEQILSKLEMLDAIEKSVKVLQETLAKMDSRILTLESAQASINRDMNDLKDSLNFTQDQYTKSSAIFESFKDQADLKLAELTRKKDELDGKIKELESKNLYLEAYSRRENIKFENIKEEPGQSGQQEDTEEALRNFLETHLGYEEARDVEIQRVHRLSTKKTDASKGVKPIIARFLRYKDCERILSLGHRLKDTEYRMYQDLPYGLVERRRKLMDVFKAARKNKIPASFSKSQPDKLYIRGKLWPVGKPFDLFPH